MLTVKLWFQDSIYSAETTGEIFRRIQKSAEGKKIHSDDEKDFLRNLFRAIAIKVVNVRGAQLMNKETDQVTDKEKEEFNQAVAKIEPLLTRLEEQELLSFDHFLAYGEMTNTVFVSTGGTLREQIDTAKKELGTVIPGDIGGRA